MQCKLKWRRYAVADFGYDKFCPHTGEKSGYDITVCTVNVDFQHVQRRHAACKGQLRFLEKIRQLPDDVVHVVHPSWHTQKFNVWQKHGMLFTCRLIYFHSQGK